MGDDKPTLVLFAVGDGYEASFEEGKPRYQESDIAELRARYYVILIGDGTARRENGEYIRRERDR